MKSTVFGIMGWISMWSISNILHYVINYHGAKFGAFTINSTIISSFCWTKCEKNIEL